MPKTLIKNGLIFDPLGKIEGEIKDILIQDGKIVEKFSNQNNIKIIDANNKTVIPGALDIHGHFASQQVNWARLIGANNTEFKEIWNGLTLDYIARSYIANGYTFILEANVFPSLARYTIFNFKSLPVLDKAMLLNVSNLWPLELEYQKGKIDNLAVFLSDLLLMTKGFGFKVYNPFESESWNFKTLRKDVSAKGRLYNFSALDVYENLTKANEQLGMPHSVHAHIEGYEQIKAKNNLFTIIDKVKSLSLEPNSHLDPELQRSQIFHMAHACAYNIDGNNSELINNLNENKTIDVDLGFVGFDKINPCITSDRRLIKSILKGNGSENEKTLISSAVEFEGDVFAILRKFDKKNIQDCILWANGIDIALNVENKWQLQFSVNYPNYANIHNVPEIATWLVSKDARDKFMDGMNKDFLTNSVLQENDKTLTFNEYIILTRASPAKSLGLGNIKGSLCEGADADLNILDLSINEIDISKDHETFRNSLSNIEYVIKSGEIIKQNDKINLNHQGKIFWSKGNVEVKNKDFIMKSKRDFYQKYGSIFYESLKISIDDNYLTQIS